MDKLGTSARKMSSLLLFLAGLILFESTAWSTDCGGFIRTGDGQEAAWKSQFPIEIKISNALGISDYYLPLHYAALKWNSALGFMAFNVRMDRDVPNRESDDGINSLTLFTLYPPDDPNEAAQAVLRGSSHIREADVLVYPQHRRYSTSPTNEELDLNQILLHELGHVLGLDHDSNPASVMRRRIPRGPIQLEITRDLVEKIRCKYR